MRINKSTITAAIALVASAVVATDSKVIGPFALRITGKTNSGIDGYAWACHAGAAIEGICYTKGSSEAVSGSPYEFYYNYTHSGNYLYPGSLSYVFAYEDGAAGQTVEVPSFLRLFPNWASNVHLALIPPGTEGWTPVSLDFDTGYFYMTSLVDDRRANATAPYGETPVNAANFHLCYQWTGGYWYYSLAWVSGLEGGPQNPSCEPVNLGVQGLASLL